MKILNCKTNIFSHNMISLSKNSQTDLESTYFPSNNSKRSTKIQKKENKVNFKNICIKSAKVKEAEFVIKFPTSFTI